MFVRDATISCIRPLAHHGAAIASSGVEVRLVCVLRVMK